MMYLEQKVLGPRDHVRVQTLVSPTLGLCTRVALVWWGPRAAQETRTRNLGIGNMYIVLPQNIVSMKVCLALKKL
jgi:hypothetical protein